MYVIPRQKCNPDGDEGASRSIWESSPGLVRYGCISFDTQMNAIGSRWILVGECRWRLALESAFLHVQIHGFLGKQNTICMYIAYILYTQMPCCKQNILKHMIPHDALKLHLLFV